MAKVTLQDRERIQEAMEKHPDLAACFLEMIDTMEDTHHTLNRGDDAEEAVLKVINKTGLMILQEWMLKKNRESEIAASKTPDIRPHKKKVLWKTCLGWVTLTTGSYLTKKRSKQPSQSIMPLRELTGVFHLCVSKNLRRLTVDMASYCSFEQAAVRMKEHHGVDVNASLVRKLTLKAGEAAAEILDAEIEKPISERSGMLIMQMDGVMVPVTSSTKSADRRKTKIVQYQEMKVGIIRKPEAIESLSACSFEGADLLGKRLGKLLTGLGGDASTKVHGLGDGALWIPEQGEQIAGCNYSHLIDFYHFAEYLYDAFEGDLRRDLKVSRSKQEAKAGQMSKVMRRLYRRAKEHPDHEGVKACISYIKNRANQFKYAEAIAKELPIGSGEVESANRSLIQQRLKLPGCWWLRENASKIACLRVVRANNGWNKLWARAA